MKRAIKIVALLLFAWFAIESSITTYDGLTDETPRADYAVVLGTKVNVDGSLSDRLQARVDRAIQLYQDSLVAHIIVSGGLGKEGYYEGNKMAKYLVKQGIPLDVITIDNAGNNTQLTAKNAARIIPNHSSARVIVVSQFFHIRRTKMAFEKVGFTQVYGAHARYFELRDLYGLAREFPAIYKYRLL